MKYGLNNTVIHRICAVLANYPQVERAILYGSRAKGDYKTGSDIDLTLDGGADLSLSVQFRIMDDLDDLLLPYTIDLSIYTQISDPDVREHIQRVGITFYTRDDALIEARYHAAIKQIRETAEHYNTSEKEIEEEIQSGREEHARDG
jgi:predicted nucleotidyltransferase